MKPFTAWLPMDGDRPKTFPSTNGRCFVMPERLPTFRLSDHAPVLIVADTPENRKKLGMEEGL